MRAFHYGRIYIASFNLSVTIAFVIGLRFGFGMGTVNMRRNVNGQSIRVHVHYTQIPCARIESTYSLMISHEFCHWVRDVS